MCRETALDHWLIKTLGTKEFQRSALTGDASFRKYYRIHVNKGSYIVMDAPPPEMPSVFIQVARILQARAINVPTIKAFNAEEGFILLSDFGDRLYLNELTQQSASFLYQGAIESLLKIQQCQGEIPCFDIHLMKKQLGIFKEWYCQRHLSLTFDTEMLQSFTLLSDKLFQVFAAQPRVFVHHDYHSRNLMVLEQGGTGILDFQDAVKGPITYDLASLFQDAYITWERSQVEVWVRQYQEKAQKLGILGQDVEFLELLRWMDLTGLQRHLKNLGIFSRLCYRDGKTRYLNDMSRLQSYIKETFERYSELHDYATFFEMVVFREDLQKCAP